MFPATISVAPNSPMARANASMVPARTPRQASGNVTRKNTRSSEAPSVRAAFSSCVSTPSNAARADLNTSGNATMAAANTAPCQVNISVIPKRLPQPLSDPAAAADHDDQVVAEHGRRHHHGQGEHRVEHVAAPESAAGQQEPRRSAEQQRRPRSQRPRP